MIRCLKNELWELFHNKLLLSALLAGIGIVCIDMLQNYFLYLRYLNTYSDLSIRVGYNSINLFNRWIAVNLDTVGYAWFFLLFPILAALPFGWSYCRDLNSGYLKQIMARTTKNNYFLAKIVAIFLSGALVIGLPLLLDLLGSAMFLPATLPDVTGMQTPIWSGHFFSTLFYSHPWCYSFLAILTDMFWGGTIAVLALAVSCIKSYSLISIIFPFALFLIEDYMATTLFMSPSSTGNPLLLSPLALLHSATVSPNPAWLVFGIMVLHLISSIIIIYFKGVKSETF